MKTLKIYLTSWIVLLMLCSLCCAVEYENRGDGFWWRGDTAYTRFKVKVQRFDSRGCPFWATEFRYRPEYSQSNRRKESSHLTRIVDTMTRVAEQRSEYAEVARIMEASGLSSTFRDAFNNQPLTYNREYLQQASSGSAYAPLNPGTQTTTSLSIRRHSDSVAALNEYSAAVKRQQESVPPAMDGLFQLSGLQENLTAEMARTAQLSDVISRMATLYERTLGNHVSVTQTETTLVPEPPGSTVPQPRQSPDYVANSLAQIIDRKCINCHTSEMQPVQIGESEVNVIEKTKTQIFPDGVILTVAYKDLTDTQRRVILDAVESGLMPVNGALTDSEIAMFKLENIERMLKN